jgi:4-alpha-glucanotransferase
LGTEAEKFIDFLAEAGQGFWQVLPVSPTGYGDSPYQSFSSYAGNPYFVDLDRLCAEGLLERHTYAGIDWGHDPERVDYGRLYFSRFRVLRIAAERFLNTENAEYRAFCTENAFWLDDYALFMALKDAHGGAAWENWEVPLKLREDAALHAARERYTADITFYKAVQFFFFCQWRDLKAYANTHGVELIGDLPIYAAPDSADVWANPHLFRLAPELCPLDVAGCPPDAFTPDGQLWGNPVYDWTAHEREGFAWWISRIRQQFIRFDVLRIDHFRGFAGYYAIPYGAETARDGLWREGPGMALFHTVRNALGDRRIIAEDLGFLDDTVRALLRESGYPGMKVLQFAFGGGDGAYLPHNYIPNCVAYTGTHDNTTALGWFENAPEEELRRAHAYLRVHEGESPARAMLAAVWGSVAELAVAPMQDILELDAQARMNTPGTLGGNWQWRIKPGHDLRETAAWLREITALYGRL